MEILVFAIASLVIGVVLAAVLGNPLWILPALIVGAILANRAGYRHQGQATAKAITATPTATPTTADVTTQIERLAKLRDSRAITAEEYDAKKAELLARL